MIKNLVTKITRRIESKFTSFTVNTALRFLPRLEPIPKAQISLIYPACQDGSGSGSTTSAQFANLLGISLDAAKSAAEIDLEDVCSRILNGPKWPDIWPGEHYKLLSALVRNLQPRTVVEIGTFLGLSALALKKFLPQGGKVYSFDIVPWDHFEHTCLKSADFDNGVLEQKLADLSDPRYFDQYSSLLADANLIFLDGPKNRTFERDFLDQLLRLQRSSATLLVIDDIRLWNMLDIWYGISEPKMDATSLGHFSGTGLVMLSP
jgi:predicted O-methyltransferase YrrM